VDHPFPLPRAYIELSLAASIVGVVLIIGVGAYSSSTNVDGARIRCGRESSRDQRWAGRMGQTLAGGLSALGRFSIGASLTRVNRMNSSVLPTPRRSTSGR